MHYMNDYDMDRSIRVLTSHAHRAPIALGAAHTLNQFREWVNSHSDGWAYWQAPVKAADRLMALVEAAVTNVEDWRREDDVDATASDLTKAYATIKAFATRYNGGAYGNRSGSRLDFDSLVCTVSFEDVDA